MRAAVQQLLLLVLFGGAGWLLLVRPQRRRAAALQRVRESVEVGAQVVTTAGLHARVFEIGADTVVLEIAPGVRTTFNRSAVVRVLEPAVGPEPEPSTAMTPAVGVETGPRVGP